jgi:hypothetical protein
MYLVSVNTFRNVELARHIGRSKSGILDGEDSVYHTEDLRKDFSHADHFLAKIGFVHDSLDCILIARYTVYTGTDTFAIFDIITITFEEAKKIISLEQRKKEGTAEEKLDVLELFDDFEVAAVIAFFEMAQVIIDEFCELNYNGPCKIIQLRRFRVIRDNPGPAYLYKFYNDSDEEGEEYEEEEN